MKKTLPLTAEQTALVNDPSVPEIVKVCTINNSDFTKYFVEKKSGLISQNAEDTATDAVLLARAYAENDKDPISSELLELEDMINRIRIVDSLEHFKSIDAKAQEIGLNKKYTPMMNVVKDALHTGFNY